ncbi:MAG: hypothetical protein Q8R02_17005 [Hyphomonadaceae bacterium]|nr:hypothetical protein [Hyphomonadaceae bacterium]
MLRFAENFTGVGTGAMGRANLLAGAWLDMGTVWTPSTVNPRGLGTAHVRNTGGHEGRFSLGGNLQSFIVGAAFFFNGLPSVGTRTFLFQPRNTSNAAQCTITVTTTGVIQLRTGSQTGTIVADSSALSPSPPIISGAYQFIEVYFDIGNGSSPADGACEVRVDGVTVIDVTGVDTQGQATNNCEQVACNSNIDGPSTMDMADLYCVDLTGANNNDFLGDTQWLDIIPDADTAASDWTRNTGSNDFEMVDDTTPDADTTYIAATTAAEISRFGLGDIPATASTVVAVVTKVMARKTDAGAANLEVSVRSTLSSPVADSTGADRPITEAYTYYRDTFEVDPATGVAWTPAGVNAIQVAVEKSV